MRLIPLPASQDNYLWFLHDGRRALVVDPGDAQPVLAALQRESLELAAILVTHPLPDHVGAKVGACSKPRTPAQWGGRWKSSQPCPAKPVLAAHMNTL